LISLFSCQERIEINPPGFEPKLVINCLFTQDSVFKVHVSHTLNYNDTTSGYISDAECYLYAGNTPLDTLKYMKNGMYISNLKPEINKHYKIKVDHPDYPMATAESYVPDKPVITQTDTSHTLIYDPYEEEHLLELTSHISDQPDQENFYEISYMGYLNYMGGQVFFSYFQSDDPVITNDGIIDYNPFLLLFSDDLFKNEKYKLNFRIFTINFDVYPDTTNYSVVLKYKGITEEYYKYIKETSKQSDYQRNQFIYTGETIDVFSNIKNGYGIFTGYSMVMDTIIY
jgi:hypothetical protein